MRSAAKGRWIAVAIFFVFMLFHQADQLLIGPLTTPIMDTFKINEVQMGLVTSGALLVGAVFYPLWGYLSDRHSRVRMISLASLIWGVTTWFGAIAPTFPLFMVARSSTGIDNSSYPGLYSLVSDYFGPKVRGKIYGLLQVSAPVGYLVGMVLALLLGGVIGWRNVFIITGSMGIVMALTIILCVKDLPRGSGEDEMAELQQVGKYEFKWKTARELFKKRTLIPLFLQGFFGVFPWQVITFWFFRYLEKERFYTSDEILITMVIAVLVLAAGYPLAGWIGDMLFKRTLRGRLIVSCIGVITGAILLYFTMNIPVENKTAFLGLLVLTALFIPFASPNVLSTVYDVTLPEVRSTANAIQSFIEQSGSAVAPTLAGFLAVSYSLKTAILSICISCWVLCFIFFLGAIFYAPKDINALHEILRIRAEDERNRETRGMDALPGMVPATSEGDRS